MRNLAENAKGPVEGRVPDQATVQYGIVRATSCAMHAPYIWFDHSIGCSKANCNHALHAADKSAHPQLPATASQVADQRNNSRAGG